MEHSGANVHLTSSVRVTSMLLVRRYFMHPQAQAAPAAPTPPQPTVVVRGASGGTTIISPPPSAPLTSRDLAVLKARRSELSDQLQSVDGRRSRLLSQLKATGDE